MDRQPPDSDALRRAALQASWRRDQRVARRRLWWRWIAWGAVRVVPVLVVAVGLAWGWNSWSHRDDAEARLASYVAERMRDDPTGRSHDMVTPLPSPPEAESSASGRSLPDLPVASTSTHRATAIEEAVPGRTPATEPAAAPASTPAASTPPSAPTAAAPPSASAPGTGPGRVQLRLDLAAAARPTAPSRPAPPGDTPR